MPYMVEMACFDPNITVEMYLTSVVFSLLATIFSIFFFEGPPLLYRVPPRKIYDAHNFNRECAIFASIIQFLINNNILKLHSEMVKIAHKTVQKCAISHIKIFSDIIPVYINLCLL